MWRFSIKYIHFTAYYQLTGMNPWCYSCNYSGIIQYGELAVNTNCAASGLFANRHMAQQTLPDCGSRIDKTIVLLVDFYRISFLIIQY